MFFILLRLCLHGKFYFVSSEFVNPGKTIVCTIILKIIWIEKNQFDIQTHKFVKEMVLTVSGQNRKAII